MQIAVRIAREDSLARETHMAWHPHFIVSPFFMSLGWPTEASPISVEGLELLVYRATYIQSYHLERKTASMNSHDSYLFCCQQKAFSGNMFTSTFLWLNKFILFINDQCGVWECPVWAPEWLLPFFHASKTRVTELLCFSGSTSHQNGCCSVTNPAGITWTILKRRHDRIHQNSVSW